MVTEREGRTEAEGRKKSSLAWRIARIGISAAIVVGIFAYAIPQVADYSAVWSIIRDLTPIETWSLIAATILNLVTYWLVNMSALPGLTFWRSAILTQTTTSVANTIPAGGAVAVGLSYTILASWGFDAQAVALYVGVTGVWNTLMKLALPVVALAFVALSGDASAALVTAACAGLVMLVIVVTVFALLLWKEAFARRIGNGLQRVVAAVRKPFGRPALEGWGDAAVDFRNRMITLVARRWIPLTLTTIASHLALWLVLLMSLRDVGVSEQEVSTATTLAVFSFGRLITALPVTPGGVGVVELGYIGGLVAAGGPRPEVVAGVLLFRTLTYVVQIPIGGVTYLLWRAEQRRAERATATA